MALCGAGIACAYDGSLALRRLLGMGGVLSGALDLLMGALAAAAMTLTALCLRIDPLRAYAFALYRFSLGAFARAIHTAARRAGRRGGAR